MYGVMYANMTAMVTAMVTAIMTVRVGGTRMAKVTVYVTDDQLAKLRAIRGLGKGGVSKAFQLFLDDAMAGAPPGGRYDYARSLMPTFSALDRHRARLARKVADGGPPADGGPISLALAVLVYRQLLEQHPDLAATLDKELARFGLDDVVAAESEGVDLAVEPEGEEDTSEEETSGFPGWSGFGMAIGDEFRDALRDAISMRVREHHHGGRPRGRSRRVEIRVTADDDPRDLLTAVDFETFLRRHADWDAGKKLTPSQIETVADLLRARSRRQEDEPEDDGE